MAAGPVSCWPRLSAESRCCGCRSGWRSSKAGGSIRRAWRSRDLIHVEARDARDALWAMEEGLRCAGAVGAVIGELWGDPAALDFTATRRLAVAAERSRRAVLAGAARRHGEPQRRADALADRERAVAGQSARPARAGRAGVGRRAVPRARDRRRAAGALAHDSGSLPSGCRAWRSSAGRRSSDLPPDAPVVLTVEGTHGLVIHAVTKAAAERGARPGARLTDARALDPSLVAVPADPAGDAALVATARALGGALVAAGRGRWRATALRLDVTGVAHLFGGEAALVEDVQAALRGARADQPRRDRADRRRRPGRWRVIGNAPAVICGKRSAGATGCAAAAGRGAAARPGDGADARAARPQDHRRAGRRCRGARSPGASARPTIRVDALDRALGRKPEPLTATPPSRRRGPAPARGAGDLSRGRGPGARAADPRPRRSSWSSGISARGGWR